MIENARVSREKIAFHWGLDESNASLSCLTLYSNKKVLSHDFGGGAKTKRRLRIAESSFTVL